MGRNRLDNKKRDVKLSVDSDLLDKLIELNVNKSALFTQAAKEKIEKYEKNKREKD